MTSGGDVGADPYSVGAADVPGEEVALIEDNQTSGTLQDQTPPAAHFGTDEHDLVTVVCLGCEMVCGLHRIPNGSAVRLRKYRVALRT
jgi:hypothetical protein